MPEPLKLLAFACLFLALTGVAAAQQTDALETDIGRVDSMSLTELSEFVGLVTAAIGADSLKLQMAAQRGDCLELTRAANSFALGYTLLGAGNARVGDRPDREALPVKARVVQARVLTFAARVRAEEWLSRRCASYVVPDDKAADRRYAQPARIATAEYTQAVIEARQAADANLASAVAAGASQKCPEVISAAQSIQLFIPYLSKLIIDLGKRPQALGPRASKRGLEASRNQLAAALNRLDREFGTRCAGRSGSGGAAAPEPVAP